MSRARNPMVLVGFLAVIAGLVTLAVLASGGSRGSESVSAAPTPEPENQPREPDPVDRTRPLAEPANATNTQLPETEPESAGDPDVRVYRTDGGSIVRDHRAGSTGQVSGEIRRPRRPTHVATDTLLAVRGKVTPIFRACADKHVTERGESPMLQATVTVSIANEKLTVDTVEVTTKDVVADGIVGCVTNDVLALALTVPGAADVSGHRITLPARLPSQ